MMAVVGLKFQVGGLINCFMKTDCTSTEMDPTGYGVGMIGGASFSTS